MCAAKGSAEEEEEVVVENDDSLKMLSNREMGCSLYLLKLILNIDKRMKRRRRKLCCLWRVQDLRKRDDAKDLI